ncbi:MAG: L,D-transpeptidase [Actinomycetes bacterium]|jgi:lipoprotein-anchoring transpeptidase ErfK/SrfK|nr:L,D-transpeptidase [Actinomycetes bacterium]
MRKRVVIFALSCLFVLCASNVAAAAILPSTTTTLTVLAKGDKTISVLPGTTRPQLLALLKANYGTAKPTISTFKFVAGGKTFKLTKKERTALTPKSINFNLLADTVLSDTAASGVTIDLNALAGKMISTKAIDKVVKVYAKKVLKPAQDKSYYYDKKKKKLGFKAAKTGLKLSTATGRKQIQAALRTLAVRGYKGGTLTTANAKRSVVQPKITKKAQMGKALLIDLSKRRIYLYSKGKKTGKTYRCAIGMKGYGTPPGTYWIGLKRPRPTWTNPGSAWAKNMASSIGPGASNPLGLRAMNLNNAKGGDTGYRIHGTAKTSSIGTAASHGCVRLTNKNIVKLYKWTPKGATVVVQP